MKKLLAVAFVLCIAGESVAQPATVLLLKQERDGAPAQHLSALELAELGDPFFNLVLKGSAHLTNLAQIEDLIQPNRAERKTFVVDENIADPRKGQSRRSVIAFSGRNGSEILNSNVMLSVFFDSNRFPDNPSSIEAWGWDNFRGRYNYYKLDNTGTPDMRPTWKFRGSSQGADLLSLGDRRNTCLACHVNGAPVMKELLFPWNNWHSFQSSARYLTSSEPPATRWPVSSSPRLGTLKGAEDLEGSLLPAITQFNERRVNSALRRNDRDGNIAIDGGGLGRVVEAKRILRPLFFTTEYNIISSKAKTGLHPFSPGESGAPSETVDIPPSLFLNANLIGGSDRPPSYVGLGIKEAQSFRGFTLAPAEYRKLVIDSGIQLGRIKPGDADFAWLGPEPSHIDNDLVDRLLRRGLVTPEFVAAVLSVDLETPILSQRRERLWRFLPESYTFMPLDLTANPLAVKRHPDALTRQMIANFEAARPAPDSAEGELLAALKHPDPLKALATKIAAYHSRVKARLNGDIADREAELRRLFESVLARRKAVLVHPVLGIINETGDRLFPIP